MDALLSNFCQTTGADVAHTTTNGQPPNLRQFVEDNFGTALALPPALSAHGAERQRQEKHNAGTPPSESTTDDGVIPAALLATRAGHTAASGATDQRVPQEQRTTATLTRPQSVGYTDTDDVMPRHSQDEDTPATALVHSAPRAATVFQPSEPATTASDAAARMVLNPLYGTAPLRRSSYVASPTREER